MTRRVALIGNPLRRRHSEVMHNAAFTHFGVGARYELRELAPEEVAGFVAAAREPEWLGFQVTAPYKQAVMSLVDDVEDGAAAIGAANCAMRRDDGTLVAFNTDAGGFLRSAEAELGMSVRGSAVAVAGAGGAARAVVHALVTAGAAEVTVGNRSPDRAAQLAAGFGDTVEGTDLGGAFTAALRRADLAVNATTVGMTAPGTPFDVAALPDSAAVYDLVYTPAETEILAAARARGLPAANGLGMLVAQAEMAFERWTGIPQAGPTMRSALESSGILTQPSES